VVCGKFQIDIVRPVNASKATGEVENLQVIRPSLLAYSNRKGAKKCRVANAYKDNLTRKYNQFTAGKTANANINPMRRQSKQDTIRDGYPMVEANVNIVESQSRGTRCVGEPLIRSKVARGYCACYVIRVISSSFHQSLWLKTS